MTAKETALRTAVLGALRDLIDSEYKAARTDLLDGLLTARDELGVKSLNVALPDGTKVASVTLVDPSDKVEIADRAAFTAWAQAQHPDKITQAESDRTRIAKVLMREFESWIDESDAVNAASAVCAALGLDTEAPPPQVDRRFEADLIDRLKPDGDGGAYDPETGEVVPGVTVQAAGTPRSFQMRYGPDGRAEIADAWRQGRLPAIDGLPQITSKED